jgi:hypothetical protein
VTLSTLQLLLLLLLLLLTLLLLSRLMPPLHFIGIAAAP